MVADTAFLSKSPVVLIDEIENAGINRQKALELIVGQDKIVLIATHDPLLALSGDKRIIETSPYEKRCLRRLNEIDGLMARCRETLRRGERLDGGEVAAGGLLNNCFVSI